MGQHRMKLDVISRMALVPFFHILIYELKAEASIFTFDHMMPWYKGEWHQWQWSHCPYSKMENETNAILQSLS